MLCLMLKERLKERKKEGKVKEKERKRFGTLNSSNSALRSIVTRNTEKRVNDGRAKWYEKLANKRGYVTVGSYVIPLSQMTTNCYIPIMVGCINSNISHIARRKSHLSSVRFITKPF